MLAPGMVAGNRAHTGWFKFRNILWEENQFSFSFVVGVTRPYTITQMWVFHSEHAAGAFTTREQCQKAMHGTLGAHWAEVGSKRDAVMFLSQGATNSGGVPTWEPRYPVVAPALVALPVTPVTPPPPPAVPPTITRHSVPRATLRVHGAARYRRPPHQHTAAAAFGFTLAECPSSAALLCRGTALLQPMSNIQAAYEGCLAGLAKAKVYRVHALVIESDSKVMVEYVAVVVHVVYSVSQTTAGALCLQKGSTAAPHVPMQSPLF